MITVQGGGTMNDHRLFVQMLEMCSLLYHEGECPKAQAKQSIAWYSDDKQCLLYPNVNQMIT
jgi:Leu/Phe-tRNA-protein transferase